MAADTFGTIWRQVRQHVPLAPPLLVQSWVTQAYRDVVDKGCWSWLRAQNQIITQPAKQGSVGVTQGSTVITDSGIGFVSTDAGRQFKVANPSLSPVYTIISVTPGVAAVIDQPFGAVSGSGATATVGDFYATVPSDFGRWIAVLDPVNNWQLRHWYTDDEINRMDAQRTASGTPFALATNMYSTYPPTAGQFRYELWPYQQAAHVYNYWYMRRAETLIDSTAFIGPLATRGDIVMTGALAYAAEWPGPDMDHRNIYMNPNLAASKRKQFEEAIARLEVIDQDVAPTWYETVSWLTQLPWAPIDSKFWQSHDSGPDYGGDYSVPWAH